MSWLSKLKKVYTVGNVVLNTMEKTGINIHGVTATEMKHALETSLTTEKTVVEAVKDVKKDLTPNKK